MPLWGLQLWLLCTNVFVRYYTGPGQLTMKLLRLQVVLFSFRMKMICQFFSLVSFFLIGHIDLWINNPINLIVPNDFCFGILFSLLSWCRTFWAPILSSAMSNSFLVSAQSLSLFLFICLTHTHTLSHTRSIAAIQELLTLVSLCFLEFLFPILLFISCYLSLSPTHTLAHNHTPKQGPSISCSENKLVAN